MIKDLKFGLKLDKYDEHDYCLDIKYHHVDLPKSFNMKDQVKNIFDQGDINSCSANSIPNQIMLSSKDKSIDFIPSRLFIYFNARLLANNNKMPLVDEGVSLRDSYRALSIYNYLDEKYYKYNKENKNETPKNDIHSLAKQTEPTITQYRKILPRIYNMQYILFIHKLPIVCGLSIYLKTFLI